MKSLKHTNLIVLKESARTKRPLWPDYLQQQQKWCLVYIDLIFFFSQKLVTANCFIFTYITSHTKRPHKFFGAIERTLNSCVTYFAIFNEKLKNWVKELYWMQKIACSFERSEEGEEVHKREVNINYEMSVSSEWMKWKKKPTRAWNVVQPLLWHHRCSMRHSNKIEKHLI